MIIYGINPVAEALKAGRVSRLRVADRASARVLELVAVAAAEGLAVSRVPAQELDRAARGGVHQGIVAEVKGREQFDISDLLDGRTEAPLIVVLDGIEDPHNVGAILRTCAAAGVGHVVAGPGTAAFWSPKVMRAGMGGVGRHDALEP